MLLYGARPLARNDEGARTRLQMDMSLVGTFKTSPRDEFDDRTIMSKFPKSRLPGLILHRRYLIDDKIVEPMNPDNFCIECTFIKEGGEEDIRYRKVLFHVRDVVAYVSKTKSSMIVSLLHKV